MYVCIVIIVERTGLGWHKPKLRAHLTNVTKIHRLQRCRQQVAGRWPFGAVVCDIFNANDVLFSTASLLHLCCVSVDRYVAVTDPFGYERRMTVRRVVVMLACLWTASALLGHLPIHFGWYHDDETHQPSDDCLTVCEFNVNKVYGRLGGRFI